MERNCLRKREMQMDEKMKRFLQMEAEKEGDCIIEEVNQDPRTRNLKAPEEMDDNVLALIDEYDAENNADKRYANLSEEDKELIELGRVYKRRKKWNKWIALVAVLVLAMAFGVTSMGGPEKVIESVKRMMAGRMQTRINSGDERLDSVEGIGEEEAYEKIEEEFGFYPVRLNCLPEGMEFKESIVSKELQTIQLIYEKENAGTITYIVHPNYRAGSMGGDVEDTLLEEYTKEVEETVISIKHYYVEENKVDRWIVEYEHHNVYYFLQMFNVNEAEAEEIIDNLYFS